MLLHNEVVLVFTLQAEECHCIHKLHFTLTECHNLSVHHQRTFISGQNRHKKCGVFCFHFSFLSSISYFLSVKSRECSVTWWPAETLSFHHNQLPFPSNTTNFMFKIFIYHFAFKNIFWFEKINAENYINWKEEMH